MAIAADGQLRGGPMSTDAAHQAADVAADVAADFMSGRRLAGPQQDGDRPRGGDVVHVDGHEAAFVMVGVEQGQLLMAVHDVDRVVDVQRHRGGWHAGHRVWLRGRRRPQSSADRPRLQARLRSPAGQRMRLMLPKARRMSATLCVTNSRLRGSAISHPDTTLGSGQQHDSAIGGDAATIKGGGDFLAADGWRQERRDRIVGHGGCGSA